MVPSDFSRQLERELNEANERIEALNRGNANAERILCELTGCESGRDVPDWIVAAKDRIKRLEEDSQRLNWLLKRGLAWRDCYNDWWKEGEWLYASQSALETIDKAKEAKP